MSPHSDSDWNRVVYHACRIIANKFAILFLTLLCFTSTRGSWKGQGQGCIGTGVNLQLKCILLSFFINSRIIVYLLLLLLLLLFVFVFTFLLRTLELFRL